MADKKLSELDVISTATISTTADLIHLVDDSESTNHKVTINQIVDDKEHTFTENQNFSSATSFLLTLRDTSAGAGEIGRIRWFGQNSAAADHIFGFVQYSAQVNTAGSESGSITWNLTEGGTENVPYLQLRGDGQDINVFKNLDISDGKNFVLDTTTGTKIGTATTQKIGFWNATPVVQPSANADTSGATLGQLETEVNEIKQLLRDIGAMAP